MATKLQKHRAYVMWLRINVGLPLAFLVLLLLVGHFYVKDNPQLFFSIFGTGDPLLIGYLVLAGVVDDTDLQMLDAKNLTPQLKHLMETREFLFYASITALIVSFISKLFSLSDTFTEHNIAKLILMMNVSLSGFLFCVCTAIWLKRSLLKLK